MVVMAATGFWQGCARKDAMPDPESQRVLARINNYKMTAEDFAHGARSFTPEVSLPEDSRDGKRRILEDLINREILIQEAQKMDLDKEKAFMNEIEDHWKQALLKSVVDKKLNELSRTVQVSDAEVRAYYDRMKRKLFAQMITLSRKEDALKLSTSTDYESAKKELAGKGLFESAPEWWVAGDLPREIEDKLFVLKPGQISAPMEKREGWMLIRLIKEEPVVIEPMDKIYALLKKGLIHKKVGEALAAWLRDLRARSSVEVDEDQLKRIVLPVKETRKETSYGT